MTTPAITVENLSKTYKVAEKNQTGLRSAIRGLFRREYKQVHAVRDISFTIDAGEMVAFLGPNGAGKTTTLKMLSGLIYPTAGAARVLGYVPWERENAYRQQFALVMGQKNQLWWDLPARESFRLHQEIYRIPPEQFKMVLDHLIEVLKIGELIGRPVRELSLGERMKMELTAALLHSPRVVFLDEPTIGLDVVAQSHLREFLRDYNRRLGVTIILTSHYMRDVESLCARALVINHGRLMVDGSLAGIIAQFSHHKIVRLQFEGDEAPTTLAQFGEVLETRGPVVRLRVDRQATAHVLAHLLDQYPIVDVNVDEVPLEEVIAEVFQTAPE